jgi:hypothetical protein
LTYLTPKPNHLLSLYHSLQSYYCWRILDATKRKMGWNIWNVAEHKRNVLVKNIFIVHVFICGWQTFIQYHSWFALMGD